MAAVTHPVVNRTALTVTGLGTLASATYVESATYTCNTNKPQSVVIESTLATTNTPAGNKKVDVFIKPSLDGTNFQSGPSSGTTVTREPNLIYLHSVPITTASTTEIGLQDILAILGYCPHSFKLVYKNDLGVALTTGTVAVAEITEVIT